MGHVSEIKIVQIGNSKGIRIPKSILQKYGFSDTVQIEETDSGVLLKRKNNKKLSWEDTFKAMKKENENWTDLDNTLLDGLDEE